MNSSISLGANFVSFDTQEKNLPSSKYHKKTKS